MFMNWFELIFGWRFAFGLVESVEMMIRVLGEDLVFEVILLFDFLSTYFLKLSASRS